MTGASSGIGRATCVILKRYGAKVVGVGRNEAALAALRDDGGIDAFVVADMRKKRSGKRKMPIPAMSIKKIPTT